jgi:tRNA (mo5U34)-methyltransferase
MLMSNLSKAAPDFAKRLADIRGTIPDVPWYPYGSLSNIPILTDFIDPQTVLVPDGGNVIDVGPADGDVGFLFHSLGCDVDFLDNASTNFNDCRALQETSKRLGHTGKLIDCDIDLGFELDREYDLAIFLGALYHLRNPALALVRLAQHCRTMLISTKVAARLPNGQAIGDVALAYLLDTREANDDPTNWWILSQPGLTRLLKRCGWRVLAAKNYGAVGRSNPVDSNADERAFLYCERVVNHADLLKHHDF